MPPGLRVVDPSETTTLPRIELNPSQELELLDREHRNIFVFGAVRSGKTTNTALIVQRSIFGDTSQRGAIFANTAAQMTNVVLHEVLHWLDVGGYQEGKHWVYGKKPPKDWERGWRARNVPIPSPTVRNYSNLIFWTGRHIVCGSLGGEHWRTYKGLTLEWIVIEELLEGIKEQALKEMMNRISCGVGAEICAAKHHHVLYAHSNPPEYPNHWIFGHMRKVVEPANKKRLERGESPLYLLIQPTTYENRRNVGEEFIQSIEDSSDEDEVQRILHGRMAQVRSGLAYSTFSRLNNVIPVPYDPARRVALCVDINVDPATALLGHVLRPDEVPEKFRIDGVECIGIFAEYYRRGGQDVEDTMRALIEGVDEGGKHLPGLHAPQNFRGLGRHRENVVLYGDATSRGRQAGAIGAQSPLQIIVSVLKENLGAKFRNRIKKSNPSVIHRLHAVKAMLRSASGRVRLFISPLCEELIADFDEVTMKPNGVELDKSNIARTHLSDELGYWCSADYPPRAQTLKALPQRHEEETIPRF